jgi:hypothetical protein
MPLFSKIKPILKKALLVVGVWVLGLFLTAGQALAVCEDGAGNPIPEIKTGLGDICPSPTGLVTFVLDLALMTTGGIAMLLLIYGGFKVLTSSGDPKAVMEGRETITSAVAGLLLVLFSVAILQIIGYNILGIPFLKP